MGSPSTPADSPSVVIALAIHGLDHAHVRLDDQHRGELTRLVRAWLITIDATEPEATAR